ncbi:ribonuclease T2-like isoform X4 [Micropterus salmoides]|uniref:ribonuclease T2-like isoform X4 n=2 Tax=Micropterus salmoides TaxID=27706 RepID=UPI0018EC3564|nr:ribonuclease T2-like isoform X4 [Micropterus salmoides]
MSCPAAPPHGKEPGRTTNMETKARSCKIKSTSAPGNASCSLCSGPQVSVRPLRVKSCCDCWPVFHSDVQELEAELTEHWPSLLKVKSSFHFWREEWEKHGVCAACVEGMNSPLRFFQICLKLRGRFDIYKLLEDAAITPSCERPYKNILPVFVQVAEVQQVLAPHLGDKHELQCVTDDKDREVWFQVKIPLSRNLTLGCQHHSDANGDPASGSGPGWNPSSGHPCPSQVPFYYFPIDHEEPRRPCS